MEIRGDIGPKYPSTPFDTGERFGVVPSFTRVSRWREEL
jgi:hypothetical protein